jgi:hypothetical protein
LSSQDRAERSHGRYGQAGFCCLTFIAQNLQKAAQENPKILSANNFLPDVDRIRLDSVET